MVFDPRSTCGMTHISDVYDDLPSVLMDESRGIRADGTERPTVQTIDGIDDTAMQVVSGTLTLWHTGILEDVVIEEGMGSIDSERFSEEVRDGQHERLEDLVAEMCGGTGGTNTPETRAWPRRPAHTVGPFNRLSPFDSSVWTY